MTKKKFIIINLIIIAFLVSLVYGLYYLAILGSTRPISRVKADARSIATGIETYRLDHGVYPPESDDFQLPGGITTPISYMSSHPSDPFEPERGKTMRYLKPSPHLFVLQSRGIDGEYNFTSEEIRIDDNFTTNDLKLFLINKTYDMSNGAISSGDIIRLSDF